MLSTGLFSQADSALVLPEAEIVSRRFSHAPVGGKNERLDSADLQNYRADNLTQLLQKESGVFVKNYGPGSIATISMRGGGAGHTVVNWNGFPLQSPMLGLLDVSLLPVSFVDEAAVSFGGNNARSGSGAIGGVIHLDNKPLFIKGLDANWQTATGSFGFWNHTGVLRYGGVLGRKVPITASTRFFWGKAKNDFPYRPLPDLPERRQIHAAQKQAGVLQEISLRPYPAGQLTFRYWQQKADRQIPPTVLQNRSEATQEDHSIRTTLHWQHTGKRSVLQARTGFFRETIDFQDVLIGEEAFTKFHSTFNEAEYQRQLSPKTRLHAGVNLLATKAFAEAYASPPLEWRNAVFATLQKELGNLQLQLDARQELRDGVAAPFIPAIGATWMLVEWAELRGKFSRLYRYPTLNDRYWKPGGNVGLQPENGWEQEIGGHFHWQAGAFKAEFNAGAYRRQLDNWIQWSLKPGDVFWSAQNVGTVRSRGLEQRIQLSCRFRKVEIKSRFGFDLIRSTHEQEVVQPKIEKGSQVWYVPENQAFGNIDLRIGGFECSFQQRYTGTVTTPGNPLPGYWLSDARLQFQVDKKRWGGLFFLQLDNLFNKNYYIIEWRPMPGRSFRAGVTFRT